MLAHLAAPRHWQEACEPKVADILETRWCALRFTIHTQDDDAQRIPAPSAAHAVLRYIRQATTEQVPPQRIKSVHLTGVEHPEVDPTMGDLPETLAHWAATERG